MHACGHDSHVAILMGVAKVLASVRAQLPGTVKFIFQPAEEGAPPGEEGGAGMMVREGVLKNPDVDAIFGLHVMQLDQTGQVSMRPLGAMASSQRFEIVVKGRQTHGATPWSGIDPIVVASQIVGGIADDREPPRGRLVVARGRHRRHVSQRHAQQHHSGRCETDRARSGRSTLRSARSRTRRDAADRDRHRSVAGRGGDAVAQRRQSRDDQRSGATRPDASDTGADIR